MAAIETTGGGADGQRAVLGGEAQAEDGAGLAADRPGAERDMAFIAGVSRAARSAPLLGGRFLLFWGTLVGAAWLGQWAILSGVAGLGTAWIGALWIAFGVVAGVGMTVLTRSVKRKPGQGAASNRVETAVWTGAGFGLFAYAGMVILAGILGALTEPAIYDTIIGVAFVVYAVAFLATAAASRQAWLRLFAAISFTGAGLVPFFLGQPVLYLISAVIVFVVAVVPGAILLSREPAALPGEDGLETA